MSEVKIIVTGLSLCKPNFLTERGLEVLFIHPLKLIEDKHRLTLTVKKGPNNVGGNKSVIKTITLEGKNKLSVIRENTDPITPTGLPNFNDKVDFDSYYGRPLRLYKSPYTQTSYLSIPAAQPYIEAFDLCTYKITEYSSAGTRPVTDGQTVSQSVGTKFKLNPAVADGFPAGSLILRIEGAVKTDIVLTYEAGTDYEIVIDNRDIKREITDKNDYQLFYEILEGRDATGREFILVFQKECSETDQQACNVSKGGGDCDFLLFFNTGNC